MIRFVSAERLHTVPELSDSMFRDRAAQFKDRLGWDVHVDERGLEKDEYDAMNPTYAIFEMADGTHGGSMRLMPSTGPTMVNDHFRFMHNDRPIVSPLIWECTRFCLSQRSRPAVRASIASAVMAGTCHFGKQVGATTGVGVMDMSMPRVYARLGFHPEVIGTAQDDSGTIGLAAWGVDASFDSICTKAKLDPDAPKKWFDASDFARNGDQT